MVEFSKFMNGTIAGLAAVNAQLAEIPVSAEKAEGAIRAVQTSATNIATELESISEANRALDEIISKQKQIDQEMDRIRQKIESINQEIQRLEGQDGTGEQIGLLKRERVTLSEQLERKAIEARDLAGRREFLESTERETLEHSVDESEQAGGTGFLQNLHFKGVAVAVRRTITTELSHATDEAVRSFSEKIDQELQGKKQSLDEFIQSLVGATDTLISVNESATSRRSDGNQTGGVLTPAFFGKIIEAYIAAEGVDVQKLEHLWAWANGPSLFGSNLRDLVRAFQRRERGGSEDNDNRRRNRRSERRSSQSSQRDEQSTDLSTAVAQGKLRLGW